jgi:rod shape-determining protein MreD
MTFALSLLMTLLLVALPLPLVMAPYLPYWPLLFVIWWALYQNHRLSMTVLFVAAIPFDVLYGTVLGLHPLLFALVAYLLTILGPRIRQVNWVRQSVVLFLVLGIAALVSYWARTLTGYDPDLVMLMMQAAISAICWSPLRIVYTWLSQMITDPVEGAN